MVTSTVCGLVISSPLNPKFSTFRFTDRVAWAVIVMTVESLALAVPRPPPETETWFTCGDVAFAATFTVTMMAE